MIAKVCDGCDVVKQLKDIVHDNLNVFVGACIDPPNICLVWHYCPKGSLQVNNNNNNKDICNALNSPKPQMRSQ